MAEVPDPAPSEAPENPSVTPVPPADPYPKMILVCMGISLFLILVIFAAIAMDMRQRVDRRVLQPTQGHPVTETAPVAEEAAP